MKEKKADDWYPFWIDKWLFGSTRIELQPDERSVFIDLLTLSRKDKGFIRANEGIPYLESQICGLLNIKPSLLKRTIEKCIKTGKIKKLDNGTYFLISTEKYALSNRHKRRLKEDIVSDDADIVSGKADTKRRGEERREEKRRGKGEQNIELPTIPKNFPLKVQDGLRSLKAQIKERERLLTEPDRIKIKQAHDGRQLTPEILGEEIEAMKKEFRQKIEDYS